MADVAVLHAYVYAEVIENAMKLNLRSVVHIHYRRLFSFWNTNNIE